MRLLTVRWSAPAWYWLLVAVMLNYRFGGWPGEFVVVLIGVWAIRDVPRADSVQPTVDAATRKVLSDLSFEDSRTDSRIQLVDTVASTFTRALNGQLMKIGWIALGRIMLGNLKMTPRMILLSDDQVLAQRQLPVRRTHAAVLTSWSNVAKSAFP